MSTRLRVTHLLNYLVSCPMYIVFLVFPVSIFMVAFIDLRRWLVFFCAVDSKLRLGVIEFEGHRSAAWHVQVPRFGNDYLISR